MNPVGPIIDPDDLAKTAHLELVSKLMADGLLAGRHRSKMKGGCAEFAEHRAYSPGDEIRLLDWRVFAKSDRYVIKQYEEEVSLQATIAMDASGSMGFGMSTVTKYAYARAASLCRPASCSASAIPPAWRSWAEGCAPSFRPAPGPAIWMS